MNRSALFPSQLSPHIGQTFAIGCPLPILLQWLLTRYLEPLSLILENFVLSFRDKHCLHHRFLRGADLQLNNFFQTMRNYFFLMTNK